MDHFLIQAKLRSVAFSAWINASRKTMLCVAVFGRIGHVLRMGTKPEIIQSIVRWISVNMVKLHTLRNVSMGQSPRNPVSQDVVNFPKVSNAGLYTSRLAIGGLFKNRPHFFFGSLPVNLSRFRIVFKSLAYDFERWHIALRRRLGFFFHSFTELVFRAARAATRSGSSLLHISPMEATAQ